MIAIWCNGSTRDFDSLCLGSNPNIASKFKTMNSNDYYFSRVNYYNVWFQKKEEEPIKLSKADKILIALMNVNKNKKKKSLLGILNSWFKPPKQQPINLSKADRILIALMNINETKKKKSWLDIIRRY